MIRGAKTRLRALEREDLPHFVQWINDPETRRFMAMRYPLSMTEEEEWWEAYRERRRDPIFAIESDDGEYIGNVGLHDIDHVNRSAELGIIIGHRTYWGRGYGSDAINALLSWAFDSLNLNRVMLRVFDYNRRAIRAYEKCGFLHEGAMRQAHFCDGAYHDQLIMGVLREEYLAHERDAARNEHGGDQL
jgi:RimJ/RimL family protein N-acetyltransferase